jgi:hypothetical protein
VVVGVCPPEEITPEAVVAGREVSCYGTEAAGDEFLGQFMIIWPGVVDCVERKVVIERALPVQSFAFALPLSGVRADGVEISCAQRRCGIHRF